MAKQDLAKVKTGIRFPVPAPIISLGGDCGQHARLKSGRKSLDTTPRHHISCHRHNHGVYSDMGWFWLSDGVKGRLERIEFFTVRNNTILKSLERKVDKLMADLSKLSPDIDALVANVGTAVTLLGSLTADIVALKAQVAALTPDPAVQAAIDALDAKVTGASVALTAGEAANPA